MTGLIDGSLSTLAPIFAVALATHKPHYAFIAGARDVVRRRRSRMAFSEGLSDTGELTGRGNPAIRGAITGVGTFLGGIFHTLPFLIPHYRAAADRRRRSSSAFELVALALTSASSFFKIELPRARSLSITLRRARSSPSSARCSAPPA